MPNKINDYALELGWDGKEVDSGLDKLEKRLQKLAATANKISSIGTKSPIFKQQKSRGSQETVTEEKRLRLEKERLAVLNAVEAKERKLKQLLDTVNTKTTRGKRLAADIQAAITKMKVFGDTVRTTTIRSQKDMVRLRTQQNLFNRSVGESIRNVRRLSREMGILERVGSRAFASFSSFAAAGLGAYAIANLGGAAFRAAKDMESLEVSMQAAFGSQEEAARQMEYVRGVSRKYALDINAAGDGWAKIALSAKASGMPMEDAREIFENTALSARAFNLSADDTKGTMRALIQMMGKGKVNAEDMRQQLAERIPAAMPILAKSMGVTYQEMEDMMARGEIGADALVGWSQEMAKLVTDSGAYEKAMLTMSAGQALLVNSLKESAKVLFGGKLDTSIGNLFKTFESFLVKNKKNVELLGNVIGDLADAFSWTFGTIIDPLLSTTVDGWRNIYDWISAISNMSIYDAHQAGGFIKWIRIATGLFYDMLVGYELLGQAFESFTLEKMATHLGYMLDDIRRTWASINGRDYTDSAGMVHEGYISKAKQGLSDMSGGFFYDSGKEASTTNNTTNGPSSTTNVSIDGVTIAAEDMGIGLESIMNSVSQVVP